MAAYLHNGGKRLAYELRRLDQDVPELYSISNAGTYNVQACFANDTQVCTPVAIINVK